MRVPIMALLAFVLQVTSDAGTIHVPADQPTVQAGIDAAVNGDVVLVSPGTYVENIDFKGKAITAKSSDGAETTIIDGGNPSIPEFGSVVSFCNDISFSLSAQSPGADISKLISSSRRIARSLSICPCRLWWKY